MLFFMIFWLNISTKKTHYQDIMNLITITFIIYKLINTEYSVRALFTAVQTSLLIIDMQSALLHTTAPAFNT